MKIAFFQAAILAVAANAAEEAAQPSYFPDLLVQTANVVDSIPDMLVQSANIVEYFFP